MLLLDTNVVSELRKVRHGKADAAVVGWVETLETANLYISVITVHELEVGVLLAERRDLKQGRVLRSWLENLVLPAFEGRVLPIDSAVGRRAAGLHVTDPRSINDAFIAATALVHGMTVATRNIADFASTGVCMVNPWDASAPGRT